MKKKNREKSQTKTNAEKATNSLGKHEAPDHFVSHNVCIAPSANVRSKVKSVLPPEYKRLRKLGRDYLTAETGIKGKYLALAEHIRRAQLCPSTVSRALKEAGLRKERIAELKRVAFVSDEIWRDFKAGIIGFKPAVEKARELDPGGKTPEIKRKLKWAKFLAQFSALTMHDKPAERFFSSNGNSLFMWSESEVVNQKNFTVGHWLLTVRKNNEKEPSKKAEKKEKQK